MFIRKINTLLKVNNRNMTTTDLHQVSLVLRHNNRLPIDAIKEITLYMGLCWQRHNGTIIHMPRELSLSIPKLVPIYELYRYLIEISQRLSGTVETHSTGWPNQHGRNQINMTVPYNADFDGDELTFL